MSDAHKGEKSYMFGKKGELAPNYGRKHNEQSKEKMSKSTSGENHPMYGKKGALNHSSKIVYQYDLNGTFIRTFMSCREAATYIGKNAANISRCALGNRSSAYNFRWSYTPTLD